MRRQVFTPHRFRTKHGGRPAGRPCELRARASGTDFHFEECFPAENLHRPSVVHSARDLPVGHVSTESA
eukprot:9682986-Alexandrium_andersonii.AAC.1